MIASDLKRYGDRCFQSREICSKREWFSDHFVYAITKGDLSVVYVGCSYDPIKRFKDHLAKSRLGRREKLRLLIVDSGRRPEMLALEKKYIIELSLRGFSLKNKACVPISSEAK